MALMDHLNLGGRCAAQLVDELQEAGEEGLALSFMGMHRRLRSLCDTTFAIWEDEQRRNPQATAVDNPKGPQ
jgi:hypothetical protein